ncbi:Amino acid/polyamine transporter I [Metarhizium album ARSEF 1941]|uniref:Amino acid/polyamine transporter I n=1 Tax=Metarhizium album (strain ARSEF 1941) TaxID=1081103 RepID=A0A0B2WKC5_METAS|nr:Amino acid/polyamine transporter I [Metarhizium album ARSEF 1941]KHN93927.1 Amino acid/polyamine transporter I [Metarhizium album ARSEF 1941]
MPRFFRGPRKSASLTLSADLGSSLEVDERGDVSVTHEQRRFSPKPRRTLRFLDDFKRNESDSFFPGHHLSPIVSRTRQPQHAFSGRFAELEIAQSGLARRLKGRHLQMIAISGSIGTGLFVMSGASLAISGPASLLLAFATAGVAMYCTCQALGELAVVFPIAGSFSSWATRFLDPSWGFALGWNYALQWLISLPVEVVAATEVIGYWNTSLPRAIFVTLFVALIVAINMLGVKGYGEAEFIFAIIKITAATSFVLFGVVLNCAGTPERGYIGFEYWRNPGAFNNGFKGFCSVLLNAVFAFSGTELIGLAAAETANPRKSLPMAIKQVFWRICLFYFSIVLLIGLVVRHNDPRLVEGANNADANASPLVIAFQEAGVQVLPSVTNAVILISVLSVANSAVFGSSRTLAALGALNQAPKPLAYIDRKGRPLIAIGLAAGIGLLAYLADLSERDNVLEWLVGIGALSSVFTWGTICLCHIRFRSAWLSRCRSVRELPYRSSVGVAGSYLGLFVNAATIVAQVWVAVAPIDYDAMTNVDLARNAVLKLLSGVLILIFYFVHKVIHRTRYVRPVDVDLNTGRRDYNVVLLEAQEREQRAKWPRWKKMYKILC